MSLRNDLAALACLLAAGCGSAPNEGLDATEQVFLFEVEYASSWFPTWTGVAIDREGRVVRYRRTDTPWMPSNEIDLTLEELEAKYAADPGLVVTVDRATLDDRFAAISGVGTNYTNPNVACADAGYLRYTAFAYDEVTRRYRPLLLRAEGDFVTLNTSADARELAAWLRVLIVDHPVEGLQPFEEGFCTP